MNYFYSFQPSKLKNFHFPWILQKIGLGTAQYNWEPKSLDFENAGVIEQNVETNNK